MKTTLLSGLLIFFLLLFGSLSGQNICLSNWQYSSTITINNLNGVPLNDFQVRFTMDTQTLIQQGKMNLNGSDIRITGDDCCTELPYWIQSGLNSPSTIIWVRVPQVLPNGQNQTLTFYYGNTLALPAANIDSVMFSIGNDSTGMEAAPTGITAATQDFSFPIDVRTVRWRIYSQGAGDITLKVSNDTNMITGTSPVFNLTAGAGFKYIDWEGITVPGGHVGYYTDDTIQMTSNCAPALPCPGGCGQLSFEPGNRGVFAALKQDTCGIVPNFKIWYRRLNFLDPNLTAPTGEFDRMAAFAATASGPTVFCNGDAINLTVPDNGANNFQWYRDGVFLPGETDTLYVATATGNYACLASFGGCQFLVSDTINISVSTPVLDLGADRVACTDLGVLLDGGGSNTAYNWSTGATSRTILATITGTYSVTVTDSNSCMAIDSVFLRIQSIPNPVIVPSGQINLCSGSNVMLESFDPGWFAYDWNSGGPTSSNIIADTAGAYYVTVYDSVNCIGTSDTVIVTLVPEPMPDLGADTTICDGDLLVLQAGGPWTSVLWPDSTTGPTYTVGVAGGYYIHVVDSFGCMGQDTIDILVDTLPLVSIGNDQTICPGTSTVISATPGFTMYAWSSGEGTADITAPAGMYQVVATDGNGCSNSSNLITISEFPVTPAPTISGDQSGVSSSTAPNYQWYLNGNIIFGANEQNYQPTEPGIYTLAVNDVNGCGLVFSNELDVVFSISLADIPEGFSPNGDGINDNFEIRNILQFNTSTVMIRNRWGSEVFKASPYNNDFNGTDDNGNRLPDGTYFYIVDPGNGDDPLSGYLIINR